MQQDSLFRVEQNLDKKGQLIDKYQIEIQDLLEEVFFNKKQINTKDNQSLKGAAERNKTINVKAGRVRAISSMKKPEMAQLTQGNTKEYQRLILGLQYALQTERKKVDDLQTKNKSLQSEISNLRNLLTGPD